ncbi:MAG: DEAD/DEAH box helicase [bacterium]
MIVFHAGILDNQFLLWGEASKTEAAAPKRRDRMPRKAGQTPYPYDAGLEALTWTFQSIGGFAPAVRPPDRTVFAWLPANGMNPVPSSPVIDEEFSAKGKPQLAPWPVSAARAPANEILPFLCQCQGKDLLAPGVLIGKDLAYWAGLSRYAGSLAARQKFLPSLEREGNAYYARWRAVIEAGDLSTRDQWIKAMPAACRALAWDSETEPQTAPAFLVPLFLNFVVDQLVRNAGARPPVSPPPRGKHKIPVFDSLHDQWLHALRGPDGKMDGDASELERLAAQIREWRRPIALMTQTPFRLAFRLEEPEDIPDETVSSRRRKKPKPDTWEVRYLLQDVQDPSLLIPLDQVWTAKGKMAERLKRTGFHIHEYLLSAMGQASNIDPHIEASLKQPNPSGHELDTPGAYAFLTEKAAILEQMNFTVLLPAWWTRKGTKLRLSARAHVKSPPMQGGSGVSLDELVQFEWRLALGGEEISYEELLELAKFKSPLVRRRGHWVQLSAEEIQEAIAFWQSKAPGQGTARGALQWALGNTGPGPSLDISGITADGWFNGLLEGLSGRQTFEELDPHPSFTGTLRPYQARGYSWMNFLQQWGLGACLADDMGLGKTVQTLAWMQRAWHENGGRPFLLICPTSVVGNWQKEAERFTPDLPVMIHHGTTRRKGAAFAKTAKRHAIVVSSYALLHRDFHLFETLTWAGVILDEAQNIKNPETKQSKAARALKTDGRIALTGTPVENNVGDLWSIMEFLNPGLLGTRNQFRERFFIPIQATRDESAIQRLKRITGPFILRREKTDKSIISDLPDKLEMKVFCNLTREQATLYTAVVNEASRDLEEAEGIQRRGVVLAALSKLKQVCNHPAQFLGDRSSIPGRSGKLARLTEMFEELLSVGDRALIFTQFAEMGAILQGCLREQFGREVLFLHGATAKSKRDQMVERFQREDGPSVFILSLKAGGTGLNLTRANHVFHFDRWWNPAVENQATDRAFRIGQTRNVQVHKFLCVGTLEEKIDAMIERKKEVAAGVVGSGEAWLTELSTEELKQLFALSQDAVGE